MLRDSPAEAPLRANRGGPARRLVAAIAFPRLGWVSLGALAAILVALPALIPMLRPGFFVSDDGLFHVYRTAALADAWRHGVLYPRLFPDFGFGYGQAVLNFYAPLAYWPAAFLAALGLNPADAIKWTIALGFLLAALAAYCYVNSLWGPLAGVAAAATYTYFPYHLADAYVRGAVPEHVAFIWPPLILWAFTAAMRDESPAGRLAQRVRFPAAYLWGALAWAALVYTHNLTALMLAPVFVVYLLVLALWTGHWRRLWSIAAACLLSVALSAPLWLPFLAESGSVGLALGPSDGYQKHLVSAAQAIQALVMYHYPFQPGTAVTHPLPLPAAVLILAVAAAAAVRLLRKQSLPAAPALGFGLVLAVGAVFMITAPSLPVWRALQPVLAQLQYPWRFLALAAAGTMLVAGALPILVPAAARLPLVLIWCVLCMVLFLPGLTLKPLAISSAEAWTPDRMWREDAAVGQVGATWTGEFLPLTVREQRWALGRSLQGAADTLAPAPVPVVRLLELSYTGARLAVASPLPLPLRLHQFYLPGWSAAIDGQPAPVAASGELGLVTVDVPAGNHTVDFRFGPTPARAAGAGLGIAGVFVWALLAWRSARPQRSGIAESQADGRLTPATPRQGRLLAPAAVTLSCLALALLANRWGLGQASETPRPANARLGDVAILLGSDVAPNRSHDALEVTLYWFALRDSAEDFKVFVHLVAPSGQVAAQQDGDPAGGFTPTTRWRSGEIVADRHILPLAPGLSAGTYEVKAGMYRYRPEGAANLPIDPPTPDGRVDLGPVQISH